MLIAEVERSLRPYLAFEIFAGAYLQHPHEIGDSFDLPVPLVFSLVEQLVDLAVGLLHFPHGFVPLHGVCQVTHLHFELLDCRSALVPLLSQPLNSLDKSLHLLVVINFDACYFFVQLLYFHFIQLRILLYLSHSSIDSFICYSFCLVNCVVYDEHDGFPETVK